MFGETRDKHFSCVILAHFSTQNNKSSNPQSSVGSFYELQFLALILCIDFQLDPGQMIGHSSSFFSLSLRPMDSFLGCVFGIIILLKHPRSFHILIILEDGSRFLIKNVSLHFSFHPSFNYTKQTSAVC